MTEQEWELRVIRGMRKELGVPEGWWGVFGDLYGPNGVRVRVSGRNSWTVRKHGKKIFGGESRNYAIKKAIEAEKQGRKA